MIIAYITALYSPFVGGLEIAVQRTAEEVAKLGHKVYVVTSDVTGRGVEEINNVKVIRVRSLNIARNYPYLITPLEIPRNVLERVDIVHGWSQSYYFAYRISLYAKKEIRKPLAYYFIGVDYLEKHYNPLIRFVGSRYQKVLTRRLARYVDLALATNESDEILLRERYGLKAHILPHGIDEVYFNTPNKAEEFRRKYHINNNRIVGYIGRIHPTKGLDLLVKAFANVIREEEDIMLVVAGRGDERYLAKCVKLAEKLGIKNRIRYLGYLSEEDKIGLIDASEVIVLPSRHAGESYPLLIDEVKARGKPLVVTNYGFLPYRVINGVEGFVVNADPNDIAKAVLTILQRGGSSRVILKPKKWSEVAQELNKLYIKIINENYTQ